MHGRLKVKTSKEQEEERKIREREKAYHFRDLTNQMFDLRETTTNDHQVIFNITGEILSINPDFYTAWNIRREALLKYCDLNPEEADETWRSELSFTMECLKTSEKSYSVWQHRIWTLSHMPASEYESEILLCNMFLSKDERNFHCWDYRSYISDIANLDIEKEFEFTTAKIKNNFSNFSAWHRRHKLLIRALALPEDRCHKSCDLRLIWNVEYDMVLNAVFTDPSDQSPWLYHNWLIKNNFDHFGEEQLTHLRTLQEMEPENKWVNMALELALEHAPVSQEAAK